MLHLVIDTATTDCTACVWDEDSREPISQKSINLKKGHGEVLFSILNDVLDAAKISFDAIGKITTSTGPGNFTGLRVGIATARGLGLGLGIPVSGYSVLETILFEDAHDNRLDDEQNQFIALDANRDQIYCLANFTTGFFKSNVPFITTPDHTKKMFGKFSEQVFFSGNCSSQLSSSLPTDSVILSEKSNANITSFARLSAQTYSRVEKPSPLYLRPADALPQMGFSVERV